MTPKKIIYLLFSLFFLSFMSIYGCGNGGGGAGGVLPTPTGTSTINMSGGAGTTGEGGNGYEIYAESYGGDVKFLKTGTVDTSFTIPTYTPLNLGANGLTIAADTTISVVNVGVPDPAVAGTPYMVLGDSNIYISDANGTSADETPVTGLQVNAGMTLTLGLNYNWYNNTGQETCYINFSKDVNILGTIKTKDLTTGTVGGGVIDWRHGAEATSLDKGLLEIDAYRIVMGTAGKIDTKGGDATVDRGGDGGAVWLYADYGGAFFNGGSIDARGGNGLGAGDGGYGATDDDNVSSGIYIWSDSVIINKAAMDASGGNGAIGGSAGYVELDAYSHVYNTAALTSNGGTGTAGDGGNAYNYGGIYIYSDYASVFNSGALTSNGGNGSANGGDGGEIDLEAADSGYSGNLVNSGAITANGGSSTSDGNGGDAESLYFYTYGGSIKNSGVITANGGNGMAGANYGGYGAYMYIESYEGSDYGWGDEVSPGPILWTGNMSLLGGSGPNGGEGGYLYVYMEDCDDDFPPTSAIQFVGYGGGINLNGGSGVAYGGDAGDFYIYIYEAWYADDYDEYIVGSMINEVAINAKGGAASDPVGEGGDGGYIQWYHDIHSYVGTTAQLKNSGVIDVSGGNATDTTDANYGGYSGGIYWYGHNLLQNTAAIIANGGSAAGAGGTGSYGAWDYIEFYSSYSVVNSGTITANGGAGTGTNASGGEGADYIEMYAGKVTNSGSIYGNGGNATGTGINGGGGEFDLFSSLGPTANTAATLQVAKGTGGTGGSNGIIWIDWVDVTPTDGTLP